MSVAAGAKTALRIASIVSNTAESDGKSLKTVLKGITAALVGMVLLIAAVTAILTSPVKFVGALGDFQKAYSYILPELDGETYPDSGTSIKNPPNTTTINGTEYTEYINSISDPDRKAIMETGLTLLGKVKYFWGGKSAAGWNDAWGKQRLVTSLGSKSTGTYRPYGMDCSGCTTRF